MARRSPDRRLELGAVLCALGVILVVGSIVAPAAFGFGESRGHSRSNGQGHAQGHGHGRPGNTTTTALGGGANQGGAYDPWGVGEPSGNGQGNTPHGAGTEGKADAKNPPGQADDGTDGNNGYECDGNRGVGRTNPAHSGCFTPAQTTTTTAPPTTTTTAPPTTTTTVPATTTTAPLTTTTTVPATTTTAPPTTTTTAGDQVLGVQFDDEAPRSLASTGSSLIVPMAAAGLLLVVAGATVLGTRRLRFGQSG